MLSLVAKASHQPKGAFWAQENALLPLKVLPLLRVLLALQWPVAAWKLQSRGLPQSFCLWLVPVLLEANDARLSQRSTDCCGCSSFSIMPASCPLMMRPSRCFIFSGKTRAGGKLLRRAVQAVCEGRDPGDLTTMDDPAALQQIVDQVKA